MKEYGRTLYDVVVMDHTQIGHATITCNHGKDKEKEKKLN
jgi:hypothetical protein